MSGSEGSGGEGAKQKLEGLLQSVPYFFYDLICRIGPGAIFMSFWIVPKFVEIKSDFVEVSFAFIVAWAIGLVIEGVFYLPAVKLQDLAKGPIDKLKLWTKTAREPQQTIQGKRLWEEERPVLVKIMAERVFFRSVAVTFFLAIWLKPNEIVELFNLTHPRLWASGGFLISSLCWFSKCLEYEIHYDTCNPRPEEKHSGHGKTHS